MRVKKLAVGVAVIGVVFGVTQTSASALTDNTPPALTSYNAVPTALDVTHGEAYGVVVLRIADAESGFDHGTLTLSNGTAALDPIDFDGGNRVNGTKNDGTYDVYATFPQGQAAGSYTATVAMTDVFANSTSVPGTSAITISRTPDSAAPSLVGTVTPTPATVDTTNASRESIVTAHLTDAVSGVASATLTVQPPITDPDFPPDPYDVELQSATGTANDGTWTGTEDFGPGQPGDYTPTALHLTDGYGNTTTLTSGLGGVVHVTATTDSTPPALDDVTGPGVTIDTTDSEQTATVHVSAHDDISGVVGGDVVYTAPDGFTTVYGSLDELPTTGTSLSGSWDVSVYFPVRSQTGTWTLTNVDLYDAQGNYTSFPSDGSLPTATIDVNSTADDAGPTLGTFTIGPSRTTAAYDGARLTGRLSFTDPISGLDHGSITFDNPTTNAVDDNVTVTFDSYEVTGTPKSGTYDFFVGIDNLPANIGHWKVDTVSLTNVAGATSTMTTTQLAGAGMSSGFDITSNAADTQAPTLTGLSVTPSTVDTTTGDKQVSFDLAVADPGTDPSGFDSASVTLTSPSTNDSVFAFIGSGDLVSGDANSGTFRSSVDIGQYAESGTWTVSEVDVWDRAQHESKYLGGDLASMGLTSTLGVTAAIDTTAPNLTGLTASSASVAAGDGVVLHTTSTDNKSGVEFVKVTMAGPGGQTVTDLEGPDAPTSPANVDLNFYFPTYNSTGQWTTSAVQVQDANGNRHDYSASDLTALGLSRSVNVTGTPDTTAPAASQLTVTPASVNSSSGPVGVDVLIHLTDAGSGLHDASLTLTSTHAIQTLKSTLGLVAGSENDGWWQGQATMPKYVDGGTWTLSLKATDFADNVLTMTSGQLTGAGLPGTISVTGAVDAVAPSMTTLAIAPSSVDTAVGGNVVLTGTATDAESGVASVVYTVTGPDASAQDLAATRISGDSSSGSWKATLEVPQWAAPGTWTVTNVAVRDVYGNLRNVSAADLTTAGQPSTFTVTGTADTAGPLLTGLTLNAASVDVSAGARSVTGQVTLTDDLSGLSGGEITFTSPNGLQTATAEVDADNRTSGTPQNATVPISLVVPAYAQPGTWTLTDATFWDVAGNARSYPADTALPATGVTSSLSVIDSNPDTTPPVLTAVSPSPSPLNVTTQSGQLTVDLTITDDRSGTSGGDVRLTSPSGQDVRYVGFGPANRQSGTSTNGVYRVTVPFTTATETGLWSIELVNVGDVAGNLTSFLGTNVPATRQVQINGTAQVPSAPTDLFATGGNQKANLVWDAPANGGAAITGYKITPYKDGVAQTVVNTAGTATSKTLTGLTNGSSYTFTVAAVNSVGTGPASAASAAVVPAPTAPGLPAVTSATPGDASVALAWTAPTDNGGSAVTGYTVTAYIAATDAFVKSVQVGGTSTTVTGLANGTAYYFGVAATNAIGTGGQGFSGTVTPVAAGSTVPGAPTGVTATLSGTTSAAVSWTAPASNGGAPITGYVVTPRIGGTAQPGLAVTTGNTTSTTVNGLAKNTTYTFTVHAVNGVGNSAESAASSGLLIPATVPGTPTSVSAVEGDAQATVSWTAPADNGGASITGYDVKAIPASGTPTETHFGDTATSHAVTGLTNGTSYTFQVRAINSVGAGSYSGSSASVTPQAPAVAAVTGLLVVPSLDSAGRPQITASWTLPAGDTGAHVCLTNSTSGAGSESCTGTDVPSSSAQSALFGPVTSGQPYTVTVFGYSGDPHAFASPAMATLAGTRITVGGAKTINYGKTLAITGTLKDAATNAVLANKSVKLYKRAASSSTWALAATVTTNSSGVASSTQKPTVKTVYQYRYAGVQAASGGAGLGATASGTQTVSVAQVVTVTATASSIRHGKVVKFYGTVSPSAVGQYVYLQHKTSTGYKTMAIKAKIAKQKLPNGKIAVGYVLSYTPTAKGTGSYRVLKPATTKNALGYSRALTLKVT